MLRGMRRALLVTGLFTLPTLLGPDIARAEPYLAIRTGSKCSQCHVNRTGGGKRNDYGRVYSQTNLSMDLWRRPEGAPSLDPYLNETISLGANLRVLQNMIAEYTTPGGDKGEAQSFSELSEANVYVEMDLVPDAVTLYVDQTLAPASANRELFGLIEGLPQDGYLKVGRMLLPYGLRIWDDDAFIRSHTGYTYNTRGTGLELGLEPGPVALVGNVTDDQLSVVGSIVYRRFTVGGSYGRDTTQGSSFSAGPFAGVNFGIFTLLGEVDHIQSGGIDQLATLAELDALVWRGFNVKATYEFYDRNTDVSSDRDGQERITLGLEPFLTQFVQVRAFYRINKFIPQNVPANQDEAFVEFHFFF